MPISTFISAYSKHGIFRGQPSQIFFAAAMSMYLLIFRPEKSKLSWGKNNSGSVWAQAGSSSSINSGISSLVTLRFPLIQLSFTGIKSCSFKINRWSSELTRQSTTASLPNANRDALFFSHSTSFFILVPVLTYIKVCRQLNTSFCRRE